MDCEAASDLYGAVHTGPRLERLLELHRECDAEGAPGGSRTPG